MHHGRSVAFLSFFAVVVAACAPSAGAPQSRESVEGVPSTPKSLVVVIQGEPKGFLPYVSGDIGGSPGGTLRMAVHQPLTTYDERGAVHPRLAVELPTREKGTWVVRGDGTMQTTLQIRRDVTWHDGAPLKASDFVFAWQIASDLDLPLESRGPVPELSRVEAPDDATLVLTWVRPTPFVHEALTAEALGPLPAHLIGSVYQADKEAFQRLPYWGREFAGVGPYRVSEWELGSHLVLKAFDRFFLGRPRIDTLTVRFAGDENTATAALLAGAADGEFRILAFQQVMHVKEEWERAGKKPLVPAQPTFWRAMDVQYRPEFARPREVADARLRRALLHAVDRKLMAEVLYNGLSTHSDTFISPRDVRWDWVKDVVVAYEYQPRRAHELLAEMGWRRGSDGAYLNAAGERVTIPLWTTSGQTWEHEMAITADHWQAIGIPTEQFVVPTAMARDRKTRATFPAFSSTAVAREFQRGVEVVYGADCPSEATRWVGGNRGCYQNPSMDRVVDGVLSAIEPAEQRRLTQELVRMQTEDLAVIPLYFHVQVCIFREGVTGPICDTVPPTSATWNVSEWDMR